MDASPQAPGEKSAESKVADFCNGFFPADGGHDSAVPIHERRRRCRGFYLAGNKLRGIFSLLRGGRRKPGYIPAFGIRDMRGIADDKNIRILGEGKIGGDDDPSGFVLLGF